MSVYQEAKKFRSDFPLTIAWRLKAHADVIERHLNPDEKVLFVCDGHYSGYNYEFCFIFMQ